MKTLQMNRKADYGNWVPAAMMITLWTATAAIALVTVLMFVLIKSPVPGVIGIEKQPFVPGFVTAPWMIKDAGLIYGIR